MSMNSNKKDSIVNDHHVPYTNLNAFGFYLAGLWEGDGHSGMSSQPYIAITFHQKNEPLALACCHLLAGFLRQKADENAWVLTLQSREALVRFVTLVHGKLRTPKKEEVDAILVWLQSLQTRDGELHPHAIRVKDLCIVPSDTSSLHNHGWFAGFFDADGSVKIRMTKPILHAVNGTIIRKGRIALACIIEQRKVHSKSGLPFQPVMQEIAHFLTVPLCERTHHGTKYWCVECSSVKRLHLVVNYFSRFPLLSSRRHDVHDWSEAYHLICQKVHLTRSGKIHFAMLKQRMNRKRQIFVWDHVVPLFAPLVIAMETPFLFSII